MRNARRMGVLTCTMLVAGGIGGQAALADNEAAGPPRGPERKPMKAVVRSREVFLPSPGKGVGILASTFESSRDGGLVSLHSTISRSDTLNVAYRRHSTDNGRTWSEPVAWPTKFKAPGGTGRRDTFGGYFDPHTGRYLIIWNEGVLPTDNPLEGMRHWTLRHAVSDDGGRTLGREEAILEDAPGFDEAHPLPGVTVGKNCVMMGDISCRPISLADGTILLPVQITPTGPDGNYHNPGKGYTYTDVAVLRGRWKPDGRISWHVSERVQGDPTRTTRGLIEPTLGVLADGRVLMVMRGSNDGRYALPGYRWFALSGDGGQTWSEAQPWTYEDGTPFFSPGACSQLLHHSSGRLLWLGNISPANPKGNSPRYPFVLGEVDPCTGLLRRDTVSVIDDRQPGEAAALTLSNFSAREDRATGEVLLHMSRFFADPAKPHPTNWEAAALVYRIAIDPL